MARADNHVVMEGVRIVFRNFKGVEGKFNRAGDRNFSVILDDDVAAAMEKDGWNVKMLKSREEGDPEQPYLPVSVKFDGYPPQIFMITSRGRTKLGEEEVDLLDDAVITNVDLIVNPYDWNVNGKTGTKAYLKSLYVTIEEDELQLKYGNLEDMATRSGRIDD